MEHPESLGQAKTAFGEWPILKNVEVCREEFGFQSLKTNLFRKS